MVNTPPIGYETGMRQLLAAVLAAGLCSGCFISRDRANEPLQKAAIDALEVGKSSATDVATALGAPAEVVQLGRRSAWRYDFTTTKTSGFTLIVVTFVNTDQRSDRCWLFFDEHDVLRHVGTTLEAEDTQYAMPWQEVD
jgi:outer membrane protein assembly factor BamE (lipoprotein component of BamABCDE complex)